MIECAVATSYADRDDESLVVAARDGDTKAYAVIFDRWFDRVFDVAVRIVRNREVAAEVAQDTFLHGWRSLEGIEQPASFGGWLLRTSRNRALNRIERERRSVASGDDAVLDIAAPDAASQELERRELHDLVWAASAALGERDASVLDLHLRHGLGAPEIADALDVTPNHAHQLLFRLKDRLATALRSWVLWHKGTPSCAALAGSLSVAGVVAFGPDAVSVIGRHARGCETCSAQQAEMLSPERLFAATPIIAAGPFLKSKAAAALDAQLISSTRPDDEPRQRGRRLWRMASAVIVVVAVVALGALASSRNGPRPTLDPAVDQPVAEVIVEPTTTTVAPVAVTTGPRRVTVTTRPPVVTTTVAPTTTTTTPPATTTTTAPTRVPGR